MWAYLPVRPQMAIFSPWVMERDTSRRARISTGVSLSQIPDDRLSGPASVLRHVC